MVQQAPEVELASIKEQLRSIRETVEDVKMSVTKILSLDRTVAQLEVRQASMDETITSLKLRMDEIETHQSTNTAYLNKVRGGISLAVTLMTLIQSALFAGACWLLSTVIDLHNEQSVMETKIVHLTEEHDRVMRSLLAAKQAALTAIEAHKGGGAE